MATRHNANPVDRGAKAARTEVVTVRFSPRTRYLLEIAARAEQRTVSNFIELAVQAALKKTVVGHDSNENEVASIEDVAPQIWDPDEPDRFARLATLFPDLLTHDEEILWKLVHETIWQGRRRPERHLQDFSVSLEDLQLLRAHWDRLKSITFVSAGIPERVTKAAATEQARRKMTATEKVTKWAAAEQARRKMTAKDLRNELIAGLRAQLEQEYSNGKDLSKADPTKSAQSAGKDQGH